MKKGFLASAKTAKEPPTRPEPSSRPVPAPGAPSTSAASPPSGYHSSPAAHPTTLHWSYYPPSSSSSPASSIALHLTAASAALLRSLPSLPDRRSLIPEPPLWEIKPIKGKGLGIVAVRDVPEGVVLWRESPLLVMDTTPGRAPSDAELEGVLRHAVAHLHPTLQAALLDLTNVFPTTPQLGHLSGLVRTNAYPCVCLPGDSVSYSGVFELLSRMNHSCDPNAILRFIGEQMLLEVKTKRTVRKGEELECAWIVTMQKRAQRMEELLVKYKFDCTCPWCSLSDKESEKKDQEREEVAKRFLTQWDN